MHQVSTYVTAQYLLRKKMFPLIYTVVLSLCGTAIFASFLAARRRKQRRDAFKKEEMSDFAGEGTKWNSKQQEYYVEKFYETGLTGKHEFHRGYHNFGYWKDEIDNYIMYQSIPKPPIPPGNPRAFDSR